MYGAFLGFWKYNNKIGNIHYKWSAHGKCNFTLSTHNDRGQFTFKIALDAYYTVYSVQKRYSMKFIIQPVLKHYCFFFFGVESFRKISVHYFVSKNKRPFPICFWWSILIWGSEQYSWFWFGYGWSMIFN